MGYYTIISLVWFLSFALSCPGIAVDTEGGAERDTVKCTPNVLIPDAKLAFGSGEKLSYVIHYKWLGIRADVGKAEVTLRKVGTVKGRNVFHAVAFGSTYKFWDVFFRVRDLYECKFYSDYVRPIYFHRDVYEGNYTMRNFFRWNDQTNEITARVERKSDPPIDTLMQGQECTFDILTLFYYARNLDFDAMSKNVNHPVSFVIDEDIFNIYFRYIGREEKKIYSLGTFRVMKFAAKVVAGEVFTGEQEMLIYVSDDQNRVPLLFESPIRVGTVSGRLVDFRNLKFPLNCRIDEKN